MKHAYMIIAHGDFDILKKTIQMLDDERNDIYIHIDKKTKNFDFDEIKRIPKKSNLTFTKRISVSWGGYSQIECEYILFKAATNNHHYDYYHLISGTDMPLASQNVIHDFFDAHHGQEFVGFQKDAQLDEYAGRIKYYHFFQSWNRNGSKLCERLQRFSLKIQKKLHVNRIKHKKIQFKKGLNWFSATDSFMRYVLQNESQVRRMYKYGHCVDEIFIQTLLYNSQHYQNLYKGPFASRRYTDWTRGCPYTFTEEDFDLLVNSGCFWARKIRQNQSGKLPDMLFQHVMREQM